MTRQFFVKRLKDHNPSMELSDIRLMDKQYLVRGPEVLEEVETLGGLWIPFTAEMKNLNTAKVLMVGPGCTRARMGEYVVFSSITGESFNHLKPQPIYRTYFDDGGLFTLDEANIRAIIPEAGVKRVEAEKEDGKDCIEPEDGPRKAAYG